MSVLNQHFDKIFCITCFEDTERQKKCISQFNKYNIDFVFVSAVDSIFLKECPVIMDGTKGISKQELSLTIAHMLCMQNAKLNGYKKIVIFEDDFKLYEDWQERFNNFINDLPIKWTILHFGPPSWVRGIYDPKLISYSKYASICKYAPTSHFMAFDESIFDECIREMYSLKNPVDIYYGDIMNRVDTCYAPSFGSLADAISMPHEKYHDKIISFKKNEYIPSRLRESCITP